MSGNVHICAEIGSNHCGNLDLAVRHIEAAARAGADSVKFQLFRPKTLDARPEVQNVLRAYALPLGWIPILQKKAHALGLEFGVTPFAVDLVEPLRRHKVDFVKISAYDLTYDDLLIAAADIGVPVVLSTAMATLEEIHRAITCVKERHYILLHGVAAYPARVEEYNLRSLITLSIPGDEVGISDHTHGHEAAIIAATLGATWIEKHFRLKDCPQNPDYEVSSTPRAFANMVAALRRTEVALGNGKNIGPLPCEMELYATCRRTNERRVRG